MHFGWCFAVSWLICGVTSEYQSTADEIRYRLPNNTKPESYDITLTTNVDQNDFNFFGTVVINIRVLEASSNITLHAHQITIIAVKLMTHTGTEMSLDKYSYNKDNDFLTISSQVQLQKDTNYNLFIDYMGELRDDNRGFFKSSYVNSNGDKIWLAATFFQPSDARHAFPCYDEPGLKAKFTIHIVHGESRHAISNMQGTRIVINNGKAITNFDQTPLMSTYLIAFIISDFNYREFNATNDYNTTQRIFTNIDHINQTSYALVEGITILKALENYLQIPFVLKKLDHAAMPDYQALDDAMENWGLITYPESRLLFDSAIHPSSRPFKIAEVMAHELSHQWFGNLVTPKWWSYLWLSEGFATLFESLAIDLVHPQWTVFNHFIVNSVQRALRFDAQSYSHPMTFYVESPSEVEQIFDDISYYKAGSVIRMFMHAFGEETFRKGLGYYLNNNLYDVADEDTLFKWLEVAAKEDKAISDQMNVKDLFGSWSNQKGFPLLRISRNYEDGSVALRQEKYDTIQNSNGSYSTAWWIPYNFASANNPVFNVTTPFGWLSKDHREMVIAPNQTDITWTNDDWLVFNRQQTGFYRILYDEQNYRLIDKELNDGDINQIHPINRAQILDDLHDFVNIGIASPNILCETMFFLKNETSYAVWETAKRIFVEWDQKLQASQKHDDFKGLVAHLVQSNYERWGLNEHEREEPFDKISRDTAVHLACNFELPQCLRDTYVKFTDMLNDYLNGTHNLWQESHNIRDLVITHGIRCATRIEIEHLWLVFSKNTNKDERMEIISSFGNVPDISIVELYLNRSFNEFDVKNISAIECQSLLTSVINSGQIGVSLGIDFLSRNLTNVNAKIKSIHSVFKSISERILTSQMETQFYDLLKNAHETELISDDEMRMFIKMAKQKLQWQGNYLKAFEDTFFTGKCTGFKKSNGTTRFMAYPTLLCIILLLQLHAFLNWKMIFTL